MKIVIIKVDISLADIIIESSCDYGSGKAVWNGHNKPHVGKVYRVEYDLTDILRWGIEITKSDLKEYKINNKNDNCYIIGKLDKYYSDDVYDLKFGESVIQLEVEGRNVPVGSFVLVKAESLEVYDLDD